MPLSSLAETPADYFAYNLLTKIQVPVAVNSAGEVVKRVYLITKGEYQSLKAITGYCEREGFFGGIATMLHRIWNAVKAIFGRSDWQVAEKTCLTLLKRVATICVEDHSILPNDYILAAKDFLNNNKHKQREIITKELNNYIKTFNALNKEKNLEKVITSMWNGLFNLIDKTKIPTDGKILFDLLNAVDDDDADVMKELIGIVKGLISPEKQADADKIISKVQTLSDDSESED